MGSPGRYGWVEPQPLGFRGDARPFFGTYDAAAHPRVGVLSEGLREHGFRSRECNAPLGLSTAARVSMLRRPWPAAATWRGGCEPVAGCGPSARCRRAGADPPDAVVVGYLGHFDVLLARRLFPAGPSCSTTSIGASDTAHRPRHGRRAAAAAAAAARRRARWRRPTSSWSTPTSTATRCPRRHRPKRRRRRRSVRRGSGSRRDGAVAPTRGPCGSCSSVSSPPLQGAPVIGAALAELGDEPEVEVTMVGARPGPRRDAAAGRAPTRACAGSAGCHRPTCPRWSPATTSASASSAPARRRAGWCRTRCSRERRPGARSSPATPLRSAGARPARGCWCRRVTLPRWPAACGTGRDRPARLRARGAARAAARAPGRSTVRPRAGRGAPARQAAGS